MPETLLSSFNSSGLCHWPKTLHARETKNVKDCAFGEHFLHFSVSVLGKSSLFLSISNYLRYIYIYSNINKYHENHKVFSYLEWKCRVLANLAIIYFTCTCILLFGDYIDKYLAQRTCIYVA